MKSGSLLQASLEASPVLSGLRIVMRYDVQPPNPVDAVASALSFVPFGTIVPKLSDEAPFTLTLIAVAFGVIDLIDPVDFTASLTDPVTVGDGATTTL